MSSAVRFLTLVPQMLIVGAIRVYQLLIRPLLGPRCRFHPSCSEYFIGAVRKYGVFSGSARRLADHALPPVPSGWLRSALGRAPQPWLRASRDRARRWAASPERKSDCCRSMANWPEIASTQVDRNGLPRTAGKPSPPDKPEKSAARAKQRGAVHSPLVGRPLVPSGSALKPAARRGPGPESNPADTRSWHSDSSWLPRARRHLRDLSGLIGILARDCLNRLPGRCRRRPGG